MRLRPSSRVQSAFPTRERGVARASIPGPSYHLRPRPSNCAGSPPLIYVRLALRAEHRTPISKAPLHWSSPLRGTLCFITPIFRRLWNQEPPAFSAAHLQVSPRRPTSHKAVDSHRSLIDSSCSINFCPSRPSPYSRRPHSSHLHSFEASHQLRSSRDSRLTSPRPAQLPSTGLCQTTDLTASQPLPIEL